MQWDAYVVGYRETVLHGVPSDWLESAPSFLSNSLQTDCNQVLVE